MTPDLALFFATSGHSGVDRLAQNLVPALARRGYAVDVLQVRGHGPQFTQVPQACASSIWVAPTSTPACRR